MLNALRRLFRRVPPHLAGRVPVDAGRGLQRDDLCVAQVPLLGPDCLVIQAARKSETPHSGPARITPAPQLPSGARPDWAVRDAERERHPQKIADERRAFAEAARQREMPVADSSEPEWESGDPRWMAHLRKAAQETAVRKMTEHQNRRVWTPPDAPQMTLEDFGWPKWCAHGDDCCLPECAPKPSPAENAKRYTREDGTW